MPAGDEAAAGSDPRWAEIVAANIKITDNKAANRGSRRIRKIAVRRDRQSIPGHAPADNCERSFNA
jgi:hypothetical protein